MRAFVTYAGMGLLALGILACVWPVRNPRLPPPAKKIERFPMKKYRSHKIVEAAQISEARPATFLILTTEGDTVAVPSDFFSRGIPQPSDYLVKYDPEYLSWSPKAVFEKGYSPLVDVVAVCAAQASKATA